MLKVMQINGCKSKKCQNLPPLAGLGGGTSPPAPYDQQAGHAMHSYTRTTTTEHYRIQEYPTSRELSWIA